MKVARYDFDAFLKGPGGAWDERVARSAHPEPWSRLDWLEPWWRSFGEPGTEEILVAGDMAAVLWVRRARVRRFAMDLRALEGWTNSQAMREPSVAFESARDAMAAVVADLVSRRREWDLIRLRGLRADRPLLEALVEAAGASGCDVQITRRWTHHRLVVGANWSSHVKEAMSSETLRRRKRLRQKLAQQGEVRCAGDGDIETFLAIDRRSWKADSGELISQDPRLEAFYREIVMRFAARSCAEIDVLRVGGVGVSSVVSLVEAGRKFMLKTSFDEAYAKTSPSWHLMEWVLEDAFSRRLVEVDFYSRSQLSGWWTDDEARFCDLDIYSPSLRGRVAAGARRLINRIRKTPPAG